MVSYSLNQLLGPRVGPNLAKFMLQMSSLGRERNVLRIIPHGQFVCIFPTCKVQGILPVTRYRLGQSQTQPSTSILNIMNLFMNHKFDVMVACKALDVICSKSCIFFYFSGIHVFLIILSIDSCKIETLYLMHQQRMTHNFHWR